MEANKKFQAFAAYEAKGDIKDFSYVPISLKSDEVELRVESCGVCHSDLHQVHNDWGGANYPLVLKKTSRHKFEGQGEDKQNERVLHFPPLPTNMNFTRFLAMKLSV
mmetsp:Transcript_8213/g.11292  ORF Transcript_8213/g.11292 Transcript_8213/m.11292 type:complete len:107 (+) Transcript_8213:108-428(+)